MPRLIYDDREPCVSNKKWKCLGRPDLGDGHRFFTRKDRPLAGLFVADNSGRYPDETDDGSLRMLLDEPGVVCDKYVTFKVRVCDDGSESHIGLGYKAAAWLAREHGAEVLFPKDALPLVDLVRASEGH